MPADVAAAGTATGEPDSSVIVPELSLRSQPGRGSRVSVVCAKMDEWSSSGLRACRAGYTRARRPG